jgi:hypothetical protein
MWIRCWEAAKEVRVLRSEGEGDPEAVIGKNSLEP